MQSYLPRLLEEVKGGMLADAMGLGKTVEAIALILANPSDLPRPELPEHKFVLPEMRARGASQLDEGDILSDSGSDSGEAEPEIDAPTQSLYSATGAAARAAASNGRKRGRERPAEKRSLLGFGADAAGLGGEVEGDDDDDSSDEDDEEGVLWSTFKKDLATDRAAVLATADRALDARIKREKQGKKQAVPRPVADLQPSAQASAPAKRSSKKVKAEQAPAPGGESALVDLAASRKQRQQRKPRARKAAGGNVLGTGDSDEDEYLERSKVPRSFRTPAATYGQVVPAVSSSSSAAAAGGAPSALADYASPARALQESVDEVRFLPARARFGVVPAVLV